MTTMNMLENLAARLQNNPHDFKLAEGVYECSKLALSEGIEESYAFAERILPITTVGIRQSKVPLDYVQLRKNVLLFLAPMDFAAYMEYIEFEREPAARFYLPRKAQLEGQHGIVTRIKKFMNDPDSVFWGLSLPPGTGKSTLIKFLLSWITGKWDQSLSMYVSYAERMTRRIYLSVKDILTNTNEYLHNDIFPRGNPDCSADDMSISYRGTGDFPTMGFVSLGGTVTGRTRANKVVVTDDLVASPEQARSPTRMNNLYDDYRTLLTSRMIGDDVKQIMLGTRWSLLDPLSRIEAAFRNDSRYWFDVVPVEDENGESNFEYKHPDNYTKKSIAVIKASIDSADYSALYLGKPIEKEGLVFAPDMLKYYPGVLPDGDPDNIIFFCDIAWGGGDSLSMPIGYDYQGNVYIVDVVFDRRDKFITKPRVIGKILHHKIRKGEFEADNGGHEYCDDVNRELLQTHRYSCALSHMKAPSTQSKMSRIEQHAPVIRTFFYLDDAKPDPNAKPDPGKPERRYRNEDYQKFMNELTSISFTAKNTHDDAPDSLAGLAAMLTPRYTPQVSYIPRIY